MFDDAYKFTTFLHDRNKLEGHQSSYLKFTINSLGYWRIHEALPVDRAEHVQLAARPEDRQHGLRGPTAGNGGTWKWPWTSSRPADAGRDPAGDKIDLLLAADLKNPEVAVARLPSASGHLEHYGFPRTVLTRNEPYLQIERFAGLHDKQLDLKSVICNPRQSARHTRRGGASGTAPPRAAPSRPRTVGRRK